MMSSGNFHFLQTTRHPLLAAIADNQYGFQARGVNHQRPYSSVKKPFRSLMGAGTNVHNSYYNGGSNDYGYGPPPNSYEQDYYQPEITNSHSGSGGYSGQSGNGYEAQPPPAPHSSSFGFGKIKKGGNSAMTALTLLSFFFFVNLLQSCLKDHINTINPTVMVMTNGVLRNRNNKLADMNSRESSTSAASTNTHEHIVLQPEDLIAAAASPVPVSAAPTLTIQSPYNIKPIQQNKPILDTQLNVQNPYLTPAPNIETKPFAYDNNFNYTNRTIIPSTEFTPTEKYHSTYNNNDRYHSPNYAVSDAYPWSYDGMGSSSLAHNRYNTPNSQESSPTSWSNYYAGNNNRYYERDRYGDAHYTRIN